MRAGRRVGRFDLASVAPRLARAHRERRAELERERLARMRAREAELKAERLVAHRDLQLVRAMHTGKRAYILARERKLDEAHRELAAARARCAELGC